MPDSDLLDLINKHMTGKHRRHAFEMVEQIQAHTKYLEDRHKAMVRQESHTQNRWAEFWFSFRDNEKKIEELEA